MSDLGKLMEKLKKSKTEKDPIPLKEDEEKKKEEIDEEIENAKDEEMEDAKELEKEEKAEEESKELVGEKEQSKPIPAKSSDAQNLVEQEVVILQNNGIFRRELLMTIKELVDVHKVNTQALLDLKEIAGGNDGKKGN